ncbi:porin family protein [Novosphingobium flavum]|uniref:Porin family protein n=1 Tax=Novosphingobium flavum TaxID=1778672 RepID=A0A7X1KMM0_9SPHN|nr:porin family protein [Novosphingobium flavum]MBC2666508.1 porin family protein [Novosphingobium flavum]
MSKTTLLLAAATAVSAVALPGIAAAQDGREPFVGPRVEAIVGYDHLRSGSSVDIDNTRDLKQSIDGVTYGVGVGYDAALGNSVRAGVEAELSDSTAKWDNNNGKPNVFNLGRVSADRDIYVGGRVGFVTSPSTMVYVKGGYTNARFGLIGTNGTVSRDQRLDTDGYRVGAGIEHQLSGNAYVKAEYRYSNYKKAEFDFNGTTPDSSRFQIDTDRHQVVVGAGLRF